MKKLILIYLSLFLCHSSFANYVRVTNNSSYLLTVKVHANLDGADCDAYCILNECLASNTQVTWNPMCGPFPFLIQLYLDCSITEDSRLANPYLGCITSPIVSSYVTITWHEVGIGNFWIDINDL